MTIHDETEAQRLREERDQMRIERDQAIRERVYRGHVTYCTLPMLLVYTVTLPGFLRNYRPKEDT